MKNFFIISAVLLCGASKTNALEGSYQISGGQTPVVIEAISGKTWKLQTAPTVSGFIWVPITYAHFNEKAELIGHTNAPHEKVEPLKNNSKAKEDK